MLYADGGGNAGSDEGGGRIHASACQSTEGAPESHGADIMLTSSIHLKLSLSSSKHMLSVNQTEADTRLYPDMQSTGKCNVGLGFDVIIVVF